MIYATLQDGTCASTTIVRLLANPNVRVQEDRTLGDSWRFVNSYQSCGL